MRRPGSVFFLFRAVFLVVFRGGFRDVVEEFLGEVQREDGVVALRFVLERGERIGFAALLDDTLPLCDAGYEKVLGMVR